MYTLIFGALITSCSQSDNRSYGDRATPEITVEKPVVMTVQLTNKYPGYLSSLQTVELKSRINGELHSRNFKEGSVVQKGDLLFTIEPTIYKNGVTQAKASLEIARAQYDYASSQYERMLKAQKSNAVSEMQVIQAKSTKEQAEAAIANAQAALLSARTNLAYCYIRAPFTGTISNATADVGSYISGAGQPFTLATLYRNDKMYAYFNVSDNQWVEYLYKKGVNKDSRIPLEITIGEEDDLIFTGTLDYLAPNVDLNTGTVMMRALIDNPQRVLKNGMYVYVTLPYATEENAVLVDPTSIGADQLGSFLYVVGDSNIVHYRSIEVGDIIGDTLQQVLRNLSPDELYVTKALMKVKEGMKIKPIEVSK